MTNPLNKISLLLIVTALCFWSGPILWAGEPFSLENGRVVPKLPEAPESLQNSDWPEEAENEMLDRFQTLIEQARERNLSFRKYGEHKAQAFPDLLLRLFTSDQEKSLQLLQEEELDGTAHHWTEGIDFYWSVVLPYQIRKYFYFGELLDPAYQQRMYSGGRRWTEEDPRPGFDLINQLNSTNAEASSYALEILLKMSTEWSNHFEPPAPNANEEKEDWVAWWNPLLERGWQIYEEKERILNPYPHPRFDHGTGPVGREWTPLARGMRADPRNTQNLRTMRDTSIYLMAEETGNERVRQLYKEKIREQIALLYQVGYGEWDADYYLTGIFAAYHNLYDFARDKEVIGLAKAALDWHYTAAALKYRRGVFGGPAKRTTTRELGNYLAFLFGNYPEEKNISFSPMALFPATSAYRPPAAVLALARQEFPAAEIFAIKPPYSPHLPGHKAKRESYETLFIGETFTLGTINSNQFSRSSRRWHLLADHSTEGAVSFFINSGNHPHRTLRPTDQIAQAGGAALWLRPNDGRSLSFSIPAGTKGRIHRNFWVLEIENTWIAIRPIGLAKEGLRPFLQNDEGGDFVLRQVPTLETPFIGFAMEVGNPESHGSLSRFISNISQVQELDLSNLSEGKIGMVTSKGIDLVLHHQEESLPQIHILGKPLDWDSGEQWSSIGGEGPVFLDGSRGELSVEAGGYSFRQTITSVEKKASKR
ncbi:MAG: hypothetical protein LAT58_02035 [Opitutales bacterium]|nr:hypothetical protein [Opitutales bacterium]